MPYLDLTSHRLHYRIDGHKGPWLLFCNSLGTDLTMWDPQVAGLEGSFRILRYDRRGHGASGAPPGAYRVDDLGGDVLQIGRAHFCGLSVGGLTGQWLALNAPERFDRMAFCATAARIGTPQGWADRISTVRNDGLASFAAVTQDRWFTQQYASRHPATVRNTIERFARTAVDGYAGCCNALAEADFRGFLNMISNPVLAIAGRDDPVCKPDELAVIATTVQHGELCLLPGRHMVNIESALAFNSELGLFLRR